MKQKLQRLLQRFIAGRYGMDMLGRVLNIPVLILLITGLFTTPAVTMAAALVVVYQYFRILSRNRTARAKENAWLLKHMNRIKKRFTQRKTHRFFTCAACKKIVRVPKGKGEIDITCPVCQNRFTRRT